MSPAWSTPLSLENRVRADGRVRMEISLMITSGHRKSFHNVVN